MFLVRQTLYTTMCLKIRTLVTCQTDNQDWPDVCLYRGEPSTGQFRQSLLLRFSAVLLFTAALSYGQTTTAPGTNDPLGRPQNYALFRDQQLLHFSPDRPGLSLSVATFDSNLKPTTLDSSPGLNFVGPYDNIPILQAVAGRFYQPVSEDVFTIRRDPSDPNGWILNTEDGQNTISSTSLGAKSFYGQVETVGWSDLFALASGDLDRAISPRGLTQDELVVAWVDTSGQVNLGVLNFGLTGNFTPVFTEAVIPGAITTYNVNPAPVDNQISVAVGDFDGDGFNEIAVAAIVPPSNGSASAVVEVSLFRYQSSGTSG